MDETFECVVAVSFFLVAACSFTAVIKGKKKENISQAATHTPAPPKRVESDNDLRAHDHEEKMSRRISRSGSLNDMAVIERRRVVVKVPATSANLGPGYDTIGMAIDIWSEFVLERSDKFEIINEGEGSYDMPTDETNLICVGVRKAFELAGKPVPTIKYHLINRIPYARGLGSSSAAIVGGLIGGLVLAGHKVPSWGQEQLIQMACQIEGHPDNVAPAIYGGIQLGIFDEINQRWVTERVNLPPGLQCVCFIPNSVGKTSTARGVLPTKVDRSEAVYNIGRVAWLINALSNNNLDQLRLGCMDALHQPQRAKAVYPHLEPIIRGAVEAGACTCYLSGAGPTVMALTSGAAGDIFTQRDKERVDRKVAQAMLDAAATTNTHGNVYISKACETGACVLSADPPFSEGVLKYTGVM